MTSPAVSYFMDIASRRFEFGKRTFIMGILNVTPDSFSDGGMYIEPSKALEHALQMQDEGADFIDVGGESTRPKGAHYDEGADPVSVDEELRRVIPVIKRLASKLSVPISVDTMKSVVAERALQEGASIVNDVSAFLFDERMISVISSHRAAAIAMHMQGNPKTMQAHPHYDNVTMDVKKFLAERIDAARNCGVDRIIVDPGIGFGKRLEDNLTILRDIHEFRALGCPVMVGVSRKGFIGTLANVSVEERVEASIGAAVVAARNGADIVRVHDVCATKRALLVADAITRPSSTHHSVTSV